MLLKNVHLTYCTNIHSGESWREHFSALKEHFPAIREQVSPESPMGIGLRLSNAASLELIEGEIMESFMSWLKSQSAYVFTMNGFPYGGFHNVRVKDQVHSPDWTSDERVAYTIRLFNILAKLLPEGIDGGISTSPLSYRHWFSPAGNELLQVRKKATENIVRVVEALIFINNETGKRLHLDIEPEPDGLLETGAEFIDWYLNDLLPDGTRYLAQRLGVNATEAERLIKHHICLCYDVCHFAIGYESHADVIRQLKENEISVGKIQISAALKAELSSNGQERRDIFQAFTSFDEPTYLHQVVARAEDGSLTRYKDLPEALANVEYQEAEEWRAHFHVPLFADNLGVLQSTRTDILEVLALQNTASFTSHLEVETYTWEVLPESLKLPLKESIIRELQWVKNQLNG